MITVYVNKKEYQLDNKITLGDMLEKLGVNPNATAVAVNDAVIPKADYPVRTLVDNDRILIIKAFYGG